MATQWSYPSFQAMTVLLDHVFGIKHWQMKPLGSGSSSVAWYARSDSLEVVIRAATPDNQKANRYQQEFAILELLHARGCPVQEPFATSTDPRTPKIPEITFDWIITRHRSGKAIRNQLLDTNNAYDIGVVLAHLHHIAVYGYGPIKITPTHFQGETSTPREGAMLHWRDYQLWGIHDQVTIESTIIGTRFAQYIEPLKALKPEIIAAVNHGDSVICHADMHNDHILLDDAGKLSAIIDFGDVCLLPAAWDFAIAARYFGWRAVDDMLDGYTSTPSDRDIIREQAYLLGLAFGVFKLQRQFVRNATVITRARTLQFINHTLNRLNQR